MDENWYTNESVWSLSFIYPDPQEDKKKKKKKATILRKQIARFVHVQVLPVHMKNTRKNNHYLGMEQAMYLEKATILRKQIARFVHVQVLPVHMKNTRKNNHYLGMEQPMYRITQNVHVPSILVQASLDYKGS